MAEWKLWQDGAYRNRVHRFQRNILADAEHGTPMQCASKWIVAALGIGDTKRTSKFGHIAGVTLWIMKNACG
jgi:hypothetical protein